MARDHARIYVRIWNDPDFRALTTHQQRMYFCLVSQPRLSYCGLLDYLPGRLAPLAADDTVETVEEVIDDLERRDFVIVDTTTSELLVRSFVRHDGLLDSPNMAKAMLKDREVIISPLLRETLDKELARALREAPQAPGWRAVTQVDPELYETLGGTLPEPSPNGSPKGSGKGSKS